jgi:ABC-2 type transport system permease protein
MTITLSPPTTATTTTGPGLLERLGSYVRNVAVLTRRNLVHIQREPAQLSDVTVQPVLFTLLFVYIFGAGIVLPNGGSYTDFAISGLLLLNLTTSSMGTAVGLSTDLTTGVIDRFRTLPMWRSAVLAGRSIADLLSATLCTAFVVLTGLVIGWRTDASVGAIVAGFGVALLFAFALSWGCACLGLVSKGPESAQSMGLLILFPLAFISNAMVPTQHMPAWLATLANWNPVSAVASALRQLWGNPNPSSTIQAWPMQHPVWAALIWSLGILAVCGPLASHLYRRRTTE